NKAVEYINTAIKLDRDSSFYYNLGLYLYNKGNESDAESAWLKGIEKDSFKQIEFKHYTFYYLALYYFDKKDYRKAKEYIEKAIELSPNNQEYIDVYAKMLKFLEENK
ncbi:MAG: tetratricopeptide repeat protein, partial [Spirochaetia bacterium]|nr:tetratricopeptide repeat protein [Spirochaetia bacterium]